MTPPADPERYKNHRFPGDLISHGVWLYYRCPLSYRDVQELLFERGITVTHEAIRQWCLKFGQDYANQLKRRRPRTGDKWHLDEVFLTINGQCHYLWRAVDQDDNVLDILVQSRRNKQAAKKFFRKLLKGLPYVPRVIITDQLKSYGAAKREILPGVEHRQSRYLNNRCENSHRPTRQRERRMQGLKSARHAQRLLAAYGPIAQPFRPRRHLLAASESRAEMRHRVESWADMIGTERAAYRVGRSGERHPLACCASQPQQLDTTRMIIVTIREPMMALFTLIVLMLMGGCRDGERPRGGARSPTVARPSAATLETCHAMYPTQPDLEHACLQRWTVDGQMPGLPQPPRGTGLTVAEILVNCKRLVGPEHVQAFLECIDRWIPVLEGAHR